MNIIDFCQGIRLPGEAQKMMLSRSVDPDSYTRMKTLFSQDYGAFTRSLCKLPDPPSEFLYYFVRFACEAYWDYKKNGYSDQLFWDTFSDFTIWCENCLKDYGVFGLMEYEWLWRHIKLRLFRLGRLQFEWYAMPCDIRGPGLTVLSGTELLNVHIPQGAPVTPVSCDDSFNRARAMFPDNHLFLCESWMLHPGLSQVMAPDSNTILFQKRFHIFKVDEEDRDAERRIFNRVEENPLDYKADTPFRQRVRRYLMEGHSLGSASGILWLE